MTKILIDEALRLADYLTDRNRIDLTCDEAAAELRRLHAENQDLRQALSDSVNQPAPAQKPLTPAEIKYIESRWDASIHGSKTAFVVGESEAAHGITKGGAA